MLVSNNLEVASTAYTKHPTSLNEKKETVQEGQKSQEPEMAAELTLSSKIKQIAEENILSSESNMMDVSRAEEMIWQANQNILNQADDAVRVQSGQTPSSVMELLK